MGEREKAAVARVMDSDVLSAFIGGPGKYFNGGPEVRAFEDKWAKTYGFAHAISVNSWSSGLMVAYGAVGLEPGDEVICPPYTMSASATTAFFYGGIPVFADIDPETFCLDPKSVAERITPRTKAIMVVHLFGRAADMGAIMKLARKHGIKVIEDAAQAPGVYCGKDPVGAIGDVGGFSLNFHKHIHTGEGGMLVTNDARMADRCRLIRNHGENAVEAPEIDDISNAIGGNYRLTELQAAIGVEQLDRLEGYLETRRKLVQVFRDALRGVPGIWVQPAPGPREHAYYVFPLKYDAAAVGLTRAQFVKAVAAELPVPEDAETTPLIEGYVRPLYLARIYRERIAIGNKHFPFSVNAGVEYRYEKGLCPVAERMHEQELLYTPLLREPLTEKDVLDFASAIRKVVEHAPTLRASADELAAAPARAQNAHARP